MQYLATETCKVKNDLSPEIIRGFYFSGKLKLRS